ncbi:hypothetical protein Glove_198g31 [Diversispora epigaea]|uniref:Serine-threonine/tyrosine-protein kinase catalytic domain-containing protein n=1 Tax=Diversispora epigaea TaxID=1348612 RepID=A0A397ITY1_9GLOM|nr:hypothetical protein Glove_198g31 [Diversispora epigaea]
MAYGICPECNQECGELGAIHYYRWIDGRIYEWDIENQEWRRYHNYSDEVALKIFDNFVNFNDEMAIHSIAASASIRFYGITQDPETHKYMIVLKYLKIDFKNINSGSYWWAKKTNNYMIILEYVNEGQYLKQNFQKLDWDAKLNLAKQISNILMFLHSNDIVHGRLNSEIFLSIMGSLN